MNSENGLKIIYSLEKLIQGISEEPESRIVITLNNYFYLSDKSALNDLNGIHCSENFKNICLPDKEYSTVLHDLETGEINPEEVIEEIIHQKLLKMVDKDVFTAYLPQFASECLYDDRNNSLKACAKRVMSEVADSNSLTSRLEKLWKSKLLTEQILRNEVWTSRAHSVLTDSTFILYNGMAIRVSV